MVPKPGNRLDSGERRPERQDQPGGEDAPGPTRKMEALVKVVSQLHKQWGIDCKPKDFTLAVARLLQIGVIDQPVDILHPEVWDKCTEAPAEETMSSGCGKYFTSWGKVVQAVQKAVQALETWRAAKASLLATPQPGVGAATLTLHPPHGGDSAKPKDPREGDVPPQSANRDPLTEGQERAKSFWGGLAEDARGAAGTTGSGEVWARPPPCAPQDGVEREGAGRGEGAFGGSREEALGLTDARKREGEENEKEKSCGGEREGGRSASEGQSANQNGRLQKCLRGANTSPSRRRGEPRGGERPARGGGARGRGRERPAPKGSARGRGLTKRHRNPGVTSQSSSDSGSDTDSNSEEKEEMGIDRVKSKNIPTRNKAEPQGGEIPLMDWRKILKIACADWAPLATLAFSVRVTDRGQRVHLPINPKDVQAIVKAIADKGLNSAVSFCSQDRIIRRPPNPYTPVTREVNESTSVLSKPESSTLAESRYQRGDFRGGCDAFV